MTAKLNLASNPFRNRALPWTVAIIVSLASLIALILIAKSTVQTNAKVATTQSDVTRLQKDISALNQRAEAIKTALTPEQQKALKSAHMLVDRKRFSWSQLFADLEAALPGGVRISRIVVKGVRAQDDRTIANLDLTVASKNPTLITQMIQDMEGQGVFHAEMRTTTLQRGHGESGAEYEMDVTYTPRAGISIAPTEKNNRPVDTAGEKPKTQ
ncbi:MAG: type pilus assembly protein PilN [Blastocatellia bacterium]|jgi:Tfp pilus assembly protein PilN|nr:type pilus assembly protein PilN [Blastocatellia bacterium]MDX6497749.1 type pilus assembly protein PilN [Blastocatellia bacterium]